MEIEGLQKENSPEKHGNSLLNRACAVPERNRAIKAKEGQHAKAVRIAKREAGMEKRLTIVIAVAKYADTRAEKLWIDSMDELYGYVSVHNSELRLIDDAITIDDPVTQREFNTRIIAENARRTQFLEAKQAYQRMQSQAFRSIAIDPTILGVK